MNATHYPHDGVGIALYELRLPKKVVKLIYKRIERDPDFYEAILAAKAGGILREFIRDQIGSELPIEWSWTLTGRVQWKSP